MEDSGQVETEKQWVNFLPCGTGNKKGVKSTALSSHLLKKQ